ncbi:MAG: thermonuclease family protein [Candidatus Omnitrophota bacterium]
MSKKFKYIQAIAIILVALIYVGVKNLPSHRGISPGPEKGEFHYVRRVVDGDTLKMSDNERVRLIGVDTPEMHHSNKLIRDSKNSGKDIKTIQALGARAYEFTKDLCLHKRVRFEYDVVRRDKYGRLLAYVYLEDGTFVNAKIIEEGYGQIMTIPPNVKHADLFKELEKQAREDRKGLWKTGLVDSR